MALMAVGLAIGWAGVAVANNAGGLPVCLAKLATRTTDLATCTADLGTCNSDLIQAEADLSACTTQLAAAQKFPATGQTTCYNSSNVVTDCANTSGQDGNIRAGAALSYTDNGDGTITDNNTGLMWEKKSYDEPIHSQYNTYTLEAAIAVHVAGLNAANFAGRHDWRLPNVKELQSIIDYGNVNLAFDPVFNTGYTPGSTVLTGSCTAPSRYLSSTSDASEPALVWGVDFSSGSVLRGGPNTEVRAVRGGL
jgi:hypothetical protein